MPHGKKFTAIVFLILSIVLATQRRTRAQVEAKNNRPDAYAVMAPLEQYLMDRNAEIALARSAAPDSIARDAKAMVFTRHGYETAVEGTNGFVCVVERSWMLPFDKPEFWNPKVRLPLCMNPRGAQFNLPLTYRTTELALGGVPKNLMPDRLKAAYDNKELPPPEPGSMCYMMSKQQYFGDTEGNAGDSHLMFWFPRGEQMDWGAEGADSPMNVHQYSPQPITEFTISVSKWSDGTAVVANEH